jgi:glutamate-1-semialdehyde 2,1-aminomutase
MTITASGSKVDEAYGRARKVLAAGIGSVARGPKVGYERPMFIAKADGVEIEDLDGNRYIDYVLALGPLIHGHRSPRMRARIDAALDQYGPMLGLSHPLEAEAAGLVVDAVPGVDLVRFHSTGTEAVMMAIRTARAYTGRQLIVKFEGHFHGWSDIVHWSVKPALADAGPADRPIPVPAVPGIAPVADTLIVLPWNDRDALAAAFAERGAEIAAVIMEPMMGNYGCIEPKPGFLELAREITRTNGSLLIFDEVVTGFRLALGGAQEYYGVIPDLTTMAKALGGGYPVSAIGGSHEVMGIIDREELPQLGTYNTSPLVMAAVCGSIEGLMEPGTYDRLFAVGNRLAAGLKEEFRAAGIPVTIRGLGPVFQLWFTDDEAWNYRDAVALGKPNFYRLFHQALLRHGVLIHPSQTEHLFVSTVHTNEHIDRTLEAAKKAVAEVRARYESEAGKDAGQGRGR